MEALIAELGGAAGARPARVRARRGRLRRGPQHRLLRAARRLRPRAAAGRSDVAAPLRVPAARLRRLRARSSSSARATCRTSPTSTSRRWSPGSTCCCSGPTPSCGGSRGWRSRPASTARSSSRSRAGRDRRGAGAVGGGPRLARRARDRSRTRGSTWPPATACTTTTAAGSTIRASRTRRWSATSRRLRSGGQIERPTEEIERERERLASEYRRCCRKTRAQPFNDLLALSRTVFPYVEEHKFFCDYWFLTQLVEQDPRVRCAARAPRLPRGRRGRVPALPPRGRLGARRAGADLGDRRRAARPQALAADRRAAQGAARPARAVDAAAGAGDRRPRRSPTR